MRATRDWRRRRLPRVRPRAERWTPGPPTHRPDQRPESGPTIADTAHRDGGAARCPEPAVPQRLAVDLAGMGHDEARRRALACAMVALAQPPEATTLSGLPTVPGLGQRRRLGRWAARPARARVPRGPAVVSAGRVGTGAPDAAGTREGTSGPPLGPADLQGACSAAAVRCRRHQPAGPPSLVRCENQDGQGTAVTVLAPQLARAVSPLVQRPTAVAMAKVLRSDGRGAGEPAASRGREGRRRATVCCRAGRLVSAPPAAHIGPGP
jgi:hypothetical protein